MARKYKRGDFWWCGVYLDGHEHRFSMKTKSAEVANRILGKIETEVAEGRFLDKKRESRWTLGQLGEFYLNRMEQLRPLSSKWRRDRIARVLEQVGPETPIEAVGPATLDRAAEEWLRFGKSVATVRANVSVLRHMMRQAYRWRAETGLSEYRLEDWTAPRGQRPRQPASLTRDEVGRLLKAAQARVRAIPEHQRAEVLLRLALATGGRVGELCRINRADFDASRGWLWLRVSKGGQDSWSALDADLARDLKALMRRSDEPFAGGAVPKDRFRRFWRAVRTEARLPHVRFHDLRHTFATHYLKRGAAPRDLQEQLGHKTSRMTDRYSHSVKRNRPRAALLWKVPTRHFPRTRPDA